MSFLQRAASTAALTLMTLGLLATSSPGLALTTPAEATSVPIINATAIPTVPASATSQPLTPLSPAIDPAVSDDDVVSPEYATLAAAVAAQDVPDDVSADLACLAGAIYFESKGEPLAGQLAVAEVILNRTKSGRFASDVCGVVKQRGQFSFVRGGEIPSIDPDRASYRTALAVARIALADAWDSPAPAALFFHARSAGMGRGATRIASIGNHIFYR